MPKLKVNKAAKKRYKVTGTGKVLHAPAKRRHLLTDKRSGTKRKLRRWTNVDERDRKGIRVLLPYR